MVSQPDLFGLEPAIPGFALVEEAIISDVEARIESAIDALPLAPFQFGQWQGKRLTANFGSAFDYQQGSPVPAANLPSWMVDLRDRIASLFASDPRSYVQALVIRYDPGAGIGWHRDRPHYGSVIGLSLSAPATLRLRQRLGVGRFERRSVILPPRSAYLLSGEVRHAWEHSIAPLDVTRRSVTLRTMCDQSATTP